MREVLRASMAALESSRPPRLVLMIITPSFILAKASVQQA
jgi:hypothetical protein